MNVLLINPYVFKNLKNREYFPPQGLFYLSEILLQNNINVKVLDLNIFHLSDLKNSNNIAEEIIMQEIKNFNPSIVGFECLFSGHMEQIIYYSKVIKNNYNNLKIVIGGIHPTIFYKDILLNVLQIDYIFLGESEYSFLDFVNNKNIEHIDGIAYRKNNNIFANKKNNFIKNLNDLHFPKYNLIDITKYYTNTNNWHNPKKLNINLSLPIISSRGCPNSCNFCSMYQSHGKMWRCRNVKNIVDEIEYLNKNYSCNHFTFFDDNFTIDNNRIVDLYKEITKRNINIQFETPNGLHVNTLNDEIINILVKIGITRITLAIESGSDFIRNKIMKKNVMRKKIYDVIKICKKYKDLKIRAYFIMGMPEDTKETLQDTYDMIQDIDIHKPQITNLLPYPGTEVFNQSVKDNLFIDNNMLKNLWKSNKMYMAGNKDFFIKPYKLELKDLIKYREKFDLLVDSTIKKNYGEQCE